jgi:hypothetical protein
MNADRNVWQVTFSDGSWVKMLGAADIGVAFDQAHREFGSFSTMESLPADDAAVVAAELADRGIQLHDKVLVNEGLFRGCKGVVFGIEDGDCGLTWVRVFVAAQDRWTRQPYCDSDLTVEQRLIDGKYVEV